ncbi:MAG: T9SS type A sorting domain-containing protein, partial [Ignavibacteriales bacterium]|nr:T9SS type A sorting domain-containing protein [Ignavibacteriales bacterium]
TNIRYAIGNKQFVTLKVYDLLGNEVETLVNENKPAGNYNVIFDASKLSSGIYFCTLKTAEFSKTNKMILTK